jgi:hypothetical protein
MKRKYLKVVIPVDWWIEDVRINDLTFDEDETEKFKQTFPTLFNDDNFVLNINLETGHIENWPTSTTGGDFRTVKLVDIASYYIIDENGDMVEDYERAYVPEVLSIVEKGYGDYLEFYVTPAGDIEEWEYDINKKLYEQPQQNR